MKRNDGRVCFLYTEGAVNALLEDRTAKLVKSRPNPRVGVSFVRTPQEARRGYARKQQWQKGIG